MHRPFSACIRLIARASAVARGSFALAASVAAAAVLMSAAPGSGAQAPPPTSDAPSQQPPATPSPTPSPSPAPPSYIRSLEVDLLPGERVTNVDTPNGSGPVTNRLRATIEYKFFGANFLEFEYRRWTARYPAGAAIASFTPAPRAHAAGRYDDRDVFVNSSIIGRQHTYVATSTFIHSTSSGAPNIHADLGFGLERLPDPSRRASFFFSYFYYPEVSGRISAAPGLPDEKLRYKVESYNAGVTLAARKEPIFVTAGIVGDHYLRKQNATADPTHVSTQLGIGVHW